jgi:hypothetical protein
MKNQNISVVAELRGPDVMSLRIAEVDTTHYNVEYYVDAPGGYGTWEVVEVYPFGHDGLEAAFKRLAKLISEDADSFVADHFGDVE